MDRRWVDGCYVATWEWARGQGVCSQWTTGGVGGHKKGGCVESQVEVCGRIGGWLTDR